MMGLNLRKLAAVVSAAAMLAVAGPVAVSTANAAETPAASETAAQHVFVQFNYGKGDIKPVGLVAGAKFSQFAAKVETPAAPEGKVFAGWANAETGELVGADVLVYFGLEVYPVFKAAPVEHVFVVFNTGADMAAPTEVAKGSTWADVKGLAPSQKAPEGKTFAGWTVDGKQVLADSYVFDAHTTNLYPLYEDAKPVETVFVVFNTGADMAAPTEVQKGSTWAEVKGLAPSQKAPEGKTFAGWTVDGKQVLADSYVFDAHTTNLYPLYEDAKPAVERVTVTFHGKDGQSGWPVQVTLDKGSKFYEFQNKFDKTVPTVDGLDFVGWSKDIHNVDADHLIDSLYEVTDSIDAFPVYVAAEQPAPAKVNVTFHQADGRVLANIDGVSGDLFDAFTAKLAARDLAPEVPAGKVFAGWQLEGGVALPELVTGDLDVYPVFKTVYQPQPQFPWWGNWWTAFQHWWGSWNHWFNGWWR